MLGRHAAYERHHVQQTRSRERTRTHTLTQVTYAFWRVLYEHSIFWGNFLEDLRPDFVGLFSCRANGGIFITMARLLSPVVHRSSGEMYACVCGMPVSRSREYLARSFGAS